MTKKILLLFIALFLVLTIVQAVSPFIQTNSIEEKGLEIRFNPINVHKQGDNLTLNFHVYNMTDGMSKTSTDTSCRLHLYNASTGAHNTILIPAINNYDFSFFIDGKNFTEKNEYNYIAWCNTSGVGGFISSEFIVTPNGEMPETAKSILYIGLLFILIVFFAIIMWAHMGDESEIWRKWWFMIIWLWAIAVTFIAWNMASDFLTSSGFIREFFFIVWMVIIIPYPFFILGLVLWTFYWIYKQKDVQSLINGGRAIAHGKTW